jgi:hypothetical protein
MLSKKEVLLKVAISSLAPKIGIKASGMVTPQISSMAKGPAVSKASVFKKVLNPR